MKKALNLFLVFGFLTVLSLGAFAHTELEPYETDLIAGGGNYEFAMHVGKVLVWNDGEYLYVKYMVTNADWCMTATHLHVATDMAAIPQKNGNPRPGQFAYKMAHECAADYTYKIPMTWPVETELYIAAHADVCTQGGASSSLDAFAAMLPDMVTMSLIRPGPMSYFHITITGGSMLDGMYDGWCADYDRWLDTNILHDAYVYSSYEELPADLIEFPENLDLVNWILNQNFVGKESPGGLGIYTIGDVQIAIWLLLEDECCLGGVTPRAEEIVEAAKANGEGFIPGCFDLIGVILVPFAGDLCPSAQIVLIPVVLPCVPVECETAWGDGFDFPGKNWAKYFTYAIQ